MNYLNKIIIGGFAGSGSSAVVDFLMEIDNISSLEREFRLISDPDGIMDLHNALVENWTPFKSDIAINRFRTLVQNLGTKGKYPYINQNFSLTISKDFIRLSEIYINQLIDFSYKGIWVGINSPRTKMLKSLKKHFNIPIRERLPEIEISYPGEEFFALTKNYLEEIIRSKYVNAKVPEHIIIDEPFSSLNPQNTLSFFHHAKTIIIHRDPRDTFLNASKYKYSFIPSEVDDFILWYKFMQLQSSKSSDKNIYRISFEDLVLNYDKEIEGLLNFLEIDPVKHVFPKRYFKPDESCKNVYLWKKEKSNPDITKIEKELSDFCYI